MGADKYGYCPICTGNAKKKLKEMYGKISQEEYETKKQLIRKLEETVWLYYEVYVNEEGHLVVKADAQCTEAVRWANQFKTLQDAWNDCTRPDWMLWLLETLLS